MGDRPDTEAFHGQPRGTHWTDGLYNDVQADLFDHYASLVVLKDAAPAFYRDLAVAHVSDDVADQGLSNFAKSEVENDFPKARAHNLVATYSTVEHFVRRTCVAWLEQKGLGVVTKPVRKLKVNLAEFLDHSDGDRWWFVVDCIERELTAATKAGCRRLDALLDAVGLVGKTDNRIAKQIDQLTNIRNVIVHRAGIVDRRFQKACPWLQFEVGKKLVLNHRLNGDAVHAASAYWFSTFVRLINRMGIECSERAAAETVAKYYTSQSLHFLQLIPSADASVPSDEKSVQD
jgi:hypothetical protein